MLQHVLLTNQYGAVVLAADLPGRVLAVDDRETGEQIGRGHVSQEQVRRVGLLTWKKSMRGEIYES